MRLGKAIFLLAFFLGDAAMAADNLEYYRSFYTNYRHPYGVTERIADRKTAEADAQGTFLVVRRDEKGRIATIQNLFDHGGKCHFHFEYVYAKNGELLSFENIQNCRPYIFAPENIVMARRDERGHPEHHRPRADKVWFLDDGSERISRQEAEKLNAYVLIRRDQDHRVIVRERVTQDRRFFIFNRYRRCERVEYYYRENGKLYSSKWYEWRELPSDIACRLSPNDGS
ncbi:MAG: hypothetical protein LBO00_06665 [Zoogloeaceae bacterium]|jgi:hypothetical protein|nr:hypothetical protein [Zoogloeaceae bacterium]